MKKVIIMTHNTLNEEGLLSLLIRLNYEPFCSTTILDELLVKTEEYNDLINKFSIIIISETVSNEEINIIFPKLKKSGKIILRKCDEYLNIETRERFRREGFADSFEKDESFDRMRELLNKHNNVSIEYMNEETINNSVNLSVNEKKILDQLKKMNSDYLSREALCLSIWGKASSSQLSQLSGLVKKINYKLSLNKGISNLEIRTSWGRGYYLNRNWK